MPHEVVHRRAGAIPETEFEMVPVLQRTDAIKLTQIA
jgi:hypothetical protein